MTDALVETVPERSIVNTRAVAVFLALSFGLAWIAAIPLMVSGGGELGGASQLVTAAAAMTAPAVAVLVAGLVVERLRFRELVAATGLRAGSVRTVLGYSALGLLVVPLVQLLAIVAGSVLGGFDLDVSRLPEQLAAAGPMALFYFFGGLLFVVSEEWGWRGYLEPRLRPLGLWPMMLLSGVIWGVWHLPAAFAVGRSPAPWLLLYVGGSVLVGVVLCWLRLRTGSIWPAVVAHCTISGFPGPLLPQWLSDGTYAPAQDGLWFGPLGFATWPFYGLLILALAGAGQLRPNVTT